MTVQRHPLLGRGAAGRGALPGCQLHGVQVGQDALPADWEPAALKVGSPSPLGLAALACQPPTWHATRFTWLRFLRSVLLVFFCPCRSIIAYFSIGFIADAAKVRH